jgi:hypothetical protein
MVDEGQPLPTPTLQDDLESFLHVWTWVLLRYTPHSWGSIKLAGRLRTFFDSFDIDEQGNLCGGYEKKSYIITGSVLDARFNHPIAPSLLRQLLQTFAVRYQPLPSTNDDDTEESEEEDIRPRRRYKRKEAKLSTSDWMLGKFNAALSDRESWPVADRSAENPLSQEPIPDRERKSQIDSLKPW